MIKQLLEFNWTVFKGSLTTAKAFVLVVYGLLLLLIFSNSIGMVVSIISVQDNAALYQQYQWLTAERARFILLAFANLLWVSQFIFTNVRQLQLEENKKLLTFGYPLHTLARHLTWIRFFHPINLLFNLVWLAFLYLQFPSVFNLPLILGLTLVNYSVIFSLKFRFLNVVKDYQKWFLSFAVISILFFSTRVSEVLSPAVFGRLDPYLATLNSLALWLPGGLLILFQQTASQPVVYLSLLIATLAVTLLLLKDHFSNTKKALQAPRGDRQRRDNSHSMAWFCRVFGSQTGKYLYYVTSHPYNRVQALFFILFPLIYLPLMLGDYDHGDAAYNFMIFFFLMYTPLGFMILSVGNMFGYENRELLLHMQFPLRRSRQIRDRYLGALLLPMSVFAVVTVLELFLFFHSPHLLTVMLGNMFIILCLLTIFTRSSFTQYEKIPWVSFSFSQPVVSRSTAMVSGVCMIILCIIIYIPYTGYEPVKQTVLSAGIIVLGVFNYRRYLNIHKLFKSKILPRLWNEL